jgi:DNA-binding transcriptional LysR family regulator
MNTPDWNDLRYFLAVIDAGSLSGAARALGVEHTTVARRIEALEQVLGLRLFDRFARGWALTDAGQSLLPQARRIEENVAGLLRQASSASDSTGGTVRISAPPALAAHWIAPRLAALRPQLRGIDIELAAEAGHADLSRREADIALRYQRPSAPDMAVRAIAQIQYRVCATADYLASQEQENWEFIGYDDSLSETPQQQWLEEFANGRRFILRSNDLATIHGAARAGAGVAVLPDYMQGPPVLPGTNCPVLRQLWMVIHDDVRKSARVRKIADLLVEIFKPLP